MDTLAYDSNIPYITIGNKMIEKEFKEHKCLTDFIKRINNKELTHFFGSLKYIELDPGKRIIKESHHRRSIYFLTYGTVSLMSGDGSDKKDVVAPYIFGEDSFLYDHEWRKSIYSLNRCRFYELSYDSFSLMKEGCVSVGCEVLKSIINLKASQIQFASASTNKNAKLLELAV